LAQYEVKLSDYTIQHILDALKKYSNIFMIPRAAKRNKKILIRFLRFLILNNKSMDFESLLLLEDLNRFNQCNLWMAIAQKFNERACELNIYTKNELFTAMRSFENGFRVDFPDIFNIDETKALIGNIISNGKDLDCLSFLKKPEKVFQEEIHYSNQKVDANNFISPNLSCINSTLVSTEDERLFIEPESPSY